MTATLTGCAYILPQTAEVLAPVSDDLILALAIDLEAIISLAAKFLGFFGLL